MRSNLLVSVIIPFLNAGRFIYEAIDSVLAQTYDRWELLLVDDGSTDRSTDIAQCYAERHPGKVRYLEHDRHWNRGLSASRNLGISKAKGEFIAFLDADDVWLPHKLQQQVAILGAHPTAAMLYGTTKYWYSWTGKVRDRRRDYVQEHGIPSNTLLKPPTLLTLFLRGRAAIPPPCSIIVRQEVFAAVAGFEESFRGMYEDQVFYAKVCLRAPVFISSQCWDRYRQHPSSLCSVAGQAGQTHAAHLIYLRWLETHLLAGGFEGTEVWQALQHELRHYKDPRRLVWHKGVRYLARRRRKLWQRIVKLVTPASIRRWR